MARGRTRLGIIVERRRLKSPWADTAWLPVSALPGEPGASAWTELGMSATGTRFYAGAVDLDLFATETAAYRDNLSSATPSLWVLLRPSAGQPPVELLFVTADPYEGEALTQASGDIVEPVPMPEEIRAWLEAFVATHHVERAFFKRRRDRADLEALARHTPGDEDDE